MAACDCCGCVFESDYGTSIVTGEGTATDPYIISMASVPFVRPAARVRRTTTQSITPSGTFVPISFDTEIFDTDAIWTVGSPTEFTINTDGIYIFGGCGLWAANGTGTRELAFRLNGSNIIQTNDQPAETTHAASTRWHHITYQYRLGAGDSLELLARQESGGALNMTAEAEDSIVFWIVYAGRVI